MSKKNKAQTTEEQNVQPQVENAETNEKVKKDNNDKKAKKAKKKEKGGNVVAKKTKETMSELKKVTWPTFPEVVKKTGVVVIIFAVLLFGLDSLFGFLFGLING